MAVTDIGAALLRTIDPETAHGLAIRALQLAPLPPARADDPILATTVAGLHLPNPVGLAAGLDKNGEALHGLSRLGFGFVECGSVTPLAQPGNPKPRLFRLSEDRAIINRMGFNNAGLEAFAGHLAARPRNAVIGANLGANKDTEDKAADYVAGLIRLKGLADYVTVNVSSPNTPGLRALQGRAALDDLHKAACREVGDTARDLLHHLALRRLQVGGAARHVDHQDTAVVDEVLAGLRGRQPAHQVLLVGQNAIWRRGRRRRVDGHEHRACSFWVKWMGVALFSRIASNASMSTMR